MRSRSRSTSIFCPAQSQISPATPAIGAKKFNDHAIQAIAAVSVALPAWTRERIYDHGAPNADKFLGRAGRAQPVRKPGPVEALDPIVCGRPQVEDRVPQTFRFLIGRQLGHSARYNFKHPPVKVARQAFYFLIAWVVKDRNGPQAPGWICGVAEGTRSQ
jgi:hypothetical protein